MVFGLLWVIFGVTLIKYPIFYDSRHGIYQNFSQVKWPLGSGFIILGVVFIFVSAKMKNNITDNFICPKCEEIIDHSGEDEVFCPKCGTKMEPLKGFYERHPELKEKSENPN